MSAQDRMAVTVINGVKFRLSANVRSAVRVFTGEAGVTFALYFAVFAVKHEAVFSTNREEP